MQTEKRRRFIAKRPGKQAVRENGQKRCGTGQENARFAKIEKVKHMKRGFGGKRAAPTKKRCRFMEKVRYRTGTCAVQGNRKGAGHEKTLYRKNGAGL